MRHAITALAVALAIGTSTASDWTPEKDRQLWNQQTKQEKKISCQVAYGMATGNESDLVKWLAPVKPSERRAARYVVRHYCPEWH